MMGVIPDMSYKTRSKYGCVILCILCLRQNIISIIFDEKDWHIDFGACSYDGSDIFKIDYITGIKK